MSDFKCGNDSVQSRLEGLYAGLKVQTCTPSMLWLHTQMRDRRTSHASFVQCSDRLLRLLIEEALSTLPFNKVEVVTPTGHTFEGLQLKQQQHLVAVSVVRAGESMEAPIRQILRDVRIGKILIQRDESLAGKPAKLFYSNLPSTIEDAKVFLLDPMLASGGSAIAAIQCLLDADVPEEAITFVNLVAAPEGVHTVFKRFPNISMCTGMIDELLDEEKCRIAFVHRAITKRVYNADICPGLGDFGDRYFGREEQGSFITSPFKHILAQEHAADLCSPKRQRRQQRRHRSRRPYTRPRFLALAPAA